MSEPNTNNLDDGEYFGTSCGPNCGCRRVSAGQPVVVWLDPLPIEADCWAALASPEEMRAYIRAIWRYMPGSMKERFMAWAHGGDRENPGDAP